MARKRHAVQAKSYATPEFNVCRNMPADLRREQIIGVSLMSKRSPGEISSQLIADTVGISQATIFKYFSIKADF